MKLAAGKYISLSFPIIFGAFILNHFVLSLSPLFISLLAGLIIGNFIQPNGVIDVGAPIMSKSGMRIGISLLGLQISFANLKSIGWVGFLAILMVVITTFTMTRILGKLLGFTPSLSLLLASGFSICGASAVAAVGAARKSDKDEIAYSVGLVTLLGTLSIFVIPSVVKVLNLQATTAGAWIGAAVHDIGQVIATASLVGGDTIKYAVITKLSRVVLLAPLLIILSLNRSDGESSNRKIKVQTFFPPFILGFIILIVVNNFISLSKVELNDLNELSKFLLSFGLFSMAIKVRYESLRRIGGRPVIFGVVMWILFGIFSLTVIRFLGI
jgi:uncharacterized integral membrane protein (TIGR00698 family)